MYNFDTSDQTDVHLKQAKHKENKMLQPSGRESHQTTTKFSRRRNLQDTPKPLQFTLQDLQQGRLTSVFSFFFLAQFLHNQVLLRHGFFFSHSYFVLYLLENRCFPLLHVLTVSDLKWGEQEMRIFSYFISTLR